MEKALNVIKCKKRSDCSYSWNYKEWKGIVVVIVINTIIRIVNIKYIGNSLNYNNKLKYG